MFVPTIFVPSKAKAFAPPTFAPPVCVTATSMLLATLSDAFLVVPSSAIFSIKPLVFAIVTVFDTSNAVLMVVVEVPIVALVVASLVLEADDVFLLSYTVV